MATVKKLMTKRTESYLIDHIDPYTGRRKRKTFKGTRIQAEILAKELELKRYRIENGIENSIYNNVYLSELVKRYKHSVNKVKNPKTVKREMISLKAFEIQMGQRMLNTIKSVDIQNFVMERLNSDLSPHTVNLDLRNLRVFFNYALRNMFIERNPVNGVIWPKATPKKVRFLTKDEIERLLEAIDDSNFRNLIITYLNTGARRDEILAPGFTWSNVDFDSSQIRLLGKGNKVRWVPMSKSVLEIMQNLKNEGKDFPYDYTSDHVSYKLGVYYKIAGITDANVHVLRKTFGSLMIQNKIADIYVVSKLLGHSSVKVTESHYVELLKENIQEPIENLSKLIK
jgi:integrase/recombinase XerC